MLISRSISEPFCLILLPFGAASFFFVLLSTSCERNPSLPVWDILSITHIIIIIIINKSFVDRSENNFYSNFKSNAFASPSTGTKFSLILSDKMDPREMRRVETSWTHTHKHSSTHVLRNIIRSLVGRNQVLEKLEDVRDGRRIKCKKKRVFIGVSIFYCSLIVKIHNYVSATRPLLLLRPHIVYAELRDEWQLRFHIYRVAHSIWARHFQEIGLNGNVHFDEGSVREHNTPFEI